MDTEEQQRICGWVIAQCVQKNDRESLLRISEAALEHWLWSDCPEWHRLYVMTLVVRLTWWINEVFP